MHWTCLAQDHLCCIVLVAISDDFELNYRARGREAACRVRADSVMPPLRFNLTSVTLVTLQPPKASKERAGTSVTLASVSEDTATRPAQRSDAHAAAARLPGAVDSAVAKEVGRSSLSQ